MSIHITDFDDEAHDRWFRVEIDYTCYDSERGSIDGGRLTYTIPGGIEIHTVEVLEVDYYNPNGDLICNIERDRLSHEAMCLLDEEAAEYVEREVDGWGCLADELWERR